MELKSRMRYNAKTRESSTMPTKNSLAQLIESHCPNINVFVVGCNKKWKVDVSKLLLN